MHASPTEHWSLTRSLAFLAATFAIVLGALLPTAVAASAPPTAAIMLCSGDRLAVVLDADGLPTSEEPASTGAMKCPLCVLTATAMLPPPAPILAVHPPVAKVAAERPLPVATTTEPAPWSRRLPPPTAPPAA